MIFTTMIPFPGSPVRPGIRVLLRFKEFMTIKNKNENNNKKKLALKYSNSLSPAGSQEFRTYFITAHLHPCHNEINIWKEVDDRGLAGAEHKVLKFK